jgi:hypothetical protein
MNTTDLSTLSYAQLKLTYKEASLILAKKIITNGSGTNTVQIKEIAKLVTQLSYEIDFREDNNV